ncbi:MAG: phospholipase D-like domain-containing protein [Eubacteriales bacterium]|nr:phospholipase D-like domain-containing protein [Eubacteriales bacterium]
MKNILLGFKFVFKYVLPLFILYIVLSLVLVPLHHKKVKDTSKLHDKASLTGNKLSVERVLNIDDNVEALKWRLRLIEEADKDIIMSTFDFRDDEAGRDIMSALLNASDRGVNVKLIIDGINGMLYLKGSENFETLCSRENVEVKLYNPINLFKPWQINYRMHDKYLIADENVYMLGGRNTNNLFLGNYQDYINIDRDIVVYEQDIKEDSSLYQLKNYFNAIWNVEQNKPIFKNPKYNQKSYDLLKDNYESLKVKYSDAFEEINWENVTMPCESINLISNSVNVENKEPELWETANGLMMEYNDVLVQTPYIICSKDMYEGLDKASNNGTEVSIIINAIESGANPWGCTDYMNQKDKVLDTGSDVYELLGSDSSHTKTILYDDSLSLVGSYNLDMRSTYLDTELMLAIESKELNEDLRKIAKNDISYSRGFSRENGEITGENYKPVEVSTGKKIFYGALRIIIPFIRQTL